MAVPARDTNDATWFVLRYPEDFSPRPGATRTEEAPFVSPSSPYLAPSLFFDEARGVLELLPEASGVEAEPPRGFAVDIRGEVYRNDDDGSLLVVRCDGSTRALVCEPNVLAQPAGLALDRRGLLYVADPAAHRVVVLEPESGHVVAILSGGGSVGPLQEPVDVAISPKGTLYVADRAGGRIVVFSAGMRPLRAFATAAPAGGSPRPMAVMIDIDGALLVADAFLPRLQRYAPDGARLSDVELSSLTAPLASGELARGALQRAYGDRMPRFFLGTCGPCFATDDAGARLAEVHRALRLLGLSLGRAFAPEGIFISAPLDSARPGTQWHRIEVELAADSPPDAQVYVETFTSDSPTPKVIEWSAPRDRSGKLLPWTTTLSPEQLVVSPRGRYLWLRLTLQTKDGAGTPSVRALRAYYPRQSWLDLLPSAFRRDPEAAAFMERFLALFEHVVTGVEDRFEEFSAELNPDAAPEGLVEWLGALVDLGFDPSWPIERRRALLAAAMELYSQRGTVAGLKRYIEIYTGVQPLLMEGFLLRPTSPVFLGRSGSVVGCGLSLSNASPQMPPEAALWERYAFRFTVYVYLDDPCDEATFLAAIDRIVETNKPAFTAHRLEAVYPNARVGMQSQVGIDFVLGAAEAPAARVGGRAEGAPKNEGNGIGAVLGVDSVLSGRRPG